jgi:hypothetical protein
VPTAIENLSKLVVRSNFSARPEILYMGVADPDLRIALDSQFHSSVAVFISAVRNNASATELLTLLGSEIATYDRGSLDTEDAEQVAANFERILDSVGLESSGGIINNWLYGFDPEQP